MLWEEKKEGEGSCVFQDTRILKIGKIFVMGRRKGRRSKGIVCISKYDSNLENWKDFRILSQVEDEVYGKKISCVRPPYFKIILKIGKIFVLQAVERV